MNKRNRLTLYERSVLAAPRLAAYASKAELEVVVTLGLVAMRKVGILRQVRVDSGLIQIETAAEPGIFKPITWALAERMVAKYRGERKPTAKAVHA